MSGESCENIAFVCDAAAGYREFLVKDRKGHEEQYGKKKKLDDTDTSKQYQSQPGHDHMTSSHVIHSTTNQHATNLQFTAKNIEKEKSATKVTTIKH